MALLIRTTGISIKREFHYCGSVEHRGRLRATWFQMSLLDLRIERALARKFLFVPDAAMHHPYLDSGNGWLIKREKQRNQVSINPFRMNRRMEFIHLGPSPVGSRAARGILPSLVSNLRFSVSHLACEAPEPVRQGPDLHTARDLSTDADGPSDAALSPTWRDS
jgi:hypothetical protein